MRSGLRAHPKPYTLDFKACELTLFAHAGLGFRVSVAATSMQNIREVGEEYVYWKFPEGVVKFPLSIIPNN